MQIQTVAVRVRVLAAIPIVLLACVLLLAIVEQDKVLVVDTVLDRVLLMIDAAVNVPIAPIAIIVPSTVMTLAIHCASAASTLVDAKAV